MKSFIYNYIRSMRLYYCFVTGTTVLAGVLIANGAGSSRATAACLLAIGFLSWGVNQIFSDFFDRKEDAINAPHRPMVTGALPARPALLLSAAIMVLFAVASVLISPWTLPVLAVGAVLNVAYSFLKKVPVINFLVYACAITCCALYGYAGITNRCPTADAVLRASASIFPVHCLMCHNSYYKDVAGDRAAGVRTLQTCLNEGFSIIVSIILFAFYLILIVSLDMPQRSFTGFVPLCLVFIHAILLVSIMSMFLRCIFRQSYHRATRLNCQLCVSMLYTPMLFREPLLLIAEALSLMAIETLFLWYTDEKE